MKPSSYFSSLNAAQEAAGAAASRGHLVHTSRPRISLAHGSCARASGVIGRRLAWSCTVVKEGPAGLATRHEQQRDGRARGAPVGISGPTPRSKRHGRCESPTYECTMYSTNTGDERLRFYTFYMRSSCEACRVLEGFSWPARSSHGRHRGYVS